MTALEQSSNRLASQSFAYAIADYLGGSSYGQSGNEPKAPDCFSPDVAGSIRRLVHAGHNSAVARHEHDEARAQFFREDVRKMRGMMKDVGLVADELFNIGYQRCAASYDHFRN